MSRWTILAVAATAALLTAADGEAADVSLGAGAGLAPDYEGSDDYTIRPLWSLRVGNIYHPATFVALDGLTLRSNLLPHPSFRLGPALQYVPGRARRTVDDDRVKRMQNVSGAIMPGLVAGYDLNLAQDSTLFVEGFGRQAVGTDNGFLGTLSGGWRGRVAPQLRLRASLATTWASEDYMDEYFGVSDRNADRAGLDRFNADSGFKDVTVGAALTYEITAAWSATVLGSYARLLGDAKDSPITDDRGSANQYFGGVTVGYRF
jgi:outer membrane scaffolding protein for murein synthesis (MipA/OmpV family)